MLPAIPSAINAGARGSAGGQASILESDDFGDRSAPRGVLPSLLPVDSRVSSTSEKVTLPPKTPPGGYSLRFNKARSVEARINDPFCDFMSNAGYNMSAAELEKLKWQLRQQPSAKALKNTQNANTKALQSSDPAFTDDTVRGVLNFLLRTKYYEESPDYQGGEKIKTIHRHFHILPRLLHRLHQSSCFQQGHSLHHSPVPPQGLPQTSSPPCLRTRPNCIKPPTGRPIGSR